MRKRLREALDADLDIGVCRFGDCQSVHRYIPFNAVYYAISHQITLCPSVAV